MKGTAIVIGAGPAGLTAAYDLAHKTEIQPIVFEATDEIGGISRTVNYKGNRIDIGGHRFFSRSQRVMDRWFEILPLQGRPARDDIACGRDIPLSDDPSAPDPERTDRVMLRRERLSRILFLRQFFDYPLSLSPSTVAGLGLRRTGQIGLSYARSRLWPIRPERSLEDFFVNRFGRELYRTFFKGYTEKVWGVPCDRIAAEWGAQRIKGLSVKRAVADAAANLLRRGDSLLPGQTETSLIRRFFYPKLGPGQMWTETADLVQARGGEIHRRQKVVGLIADERRIRAARVRDEQTGDVTEVPGDYFISTMPVQDLIAGLEPSPPGPVREVAEGLVYRDFITVGLLLKGLRNVGKTGRPTSTTLLRDCWIYVQEPHVKVGRLQIFNNWSPYLVADPSTVWIGLEYFCTEGDSLWQTSENGLKDLAIREMTELGLIAPADVLDGTVIRTLKTYPAYFGTYDRFPVIRAYTDSFANLFLVGRNGMHRYNNQDHSMLTAMTAVENIVAGERSKENIWAVNMERVYHEADASRSLASSNGTGGATAE